MGAAIVSASNGLAVVVTGYRYYRSNDHAEDVQRIYARLATARKRLGLKAPERLGGMREVMEGQLQLVQAGRVPAGAALRTSLAEGTSRIAAGMSDPAHARWSRVQQRTHDMKVVSTISGDEQRLAAQELGLRIRNR